MNEQTATHQHRPVHFRWDSWSFKWVDTCEDCGVFLNGAVA